MTNNRVCCLYRVSTDKQVDFNSNHEADLPMQRKACHKFAASKGWVIVHEEQEEGVSGHKVRAAARDKLQIIKDYARNGKFDILLVFMFDRIGRIADETPFVVEWFVRNGIRDCRTGGRDADGGSFVGDSSDAAVVSVICRGRDDIRCGGGVDSGSASEEGKVLSSGNVGSYDRLYADDDIGCCSWMIRR